MYHSVILVLMDGWMDEIVFYIFLISGWMIQNIIKYPIKTQIKHHIQLSKKSMNNPCVQHKQTQKTPTHLSLRRTNENNNNNKTKNKKQIIDNFQTTGYFRLQDRNFLLQILHTIHTHLTGLVISQTIK
mmetsp:Transcript_9177/g.14115  ORF Transcript_9177/g.14115 Transcript_9177/m.14115 type:complete len:129 (+) Transcript_9177:871-1257(+)